MAENEAIPMDDGINLEEGGESTGKIKISGGLSGIGQRAKSYNRPLNAKGTGAIRVKTFFSRVSIESLSFLDEKINEWLDQHPDIEIKFVTNTIGVMEGKTREPNLIINVWY